MIVLGRIENKPLVTVIAGVGLFTSVDSLMSISVTNLIEGFAAVRTVIGFFTSVDQHVTLRKRYGNHC
jgi:hypothetical protein